MKYLLTTIFLISAIYCFGQTITAGPGFYGITPTSGTEIISIQSKTDTTILFIGIDTIKHSHVFISDPKTSYGISTVFAIGKLCPPQGCKDDWLDEKQICEICLRHIHLQETRWIEDRYQKALDRLNKIKNPKYSAADFYPYQSNGEDTISQTCIPCHDVNYVNPREGKVIDDHITNDWEAFYKAIEAWKTLSNKKKK